MMPKLLLKFTGTYIKLLYKLSNFVFVIFLAVISLHAMLMTALKGNFIKTWIEVNRSGYLIFHTV